MLFLNNKIKTAILILIPTVFFANNAFAFDYFKNLPKEKKVFALNAGAIVATTVVGFVSWEYGQHEPHFKNEHWFSHKSTRGGADKVGHFYSTYLYSQVLSHLYTHWGYERNDAARLGALSSFMIQGAMEVGDSISKYGFSYEDFIMNGLGSLAGYLTYRYPEFSRKVDFRVEYFPSEGFFRHRLYDPSTDYDGMKFLSAIKLDGFDFVKNKYLKYLEFHVGYYSRGYKWKPYKRDKRILYAGIGINISKIVRELSFKKTSKIFNYYQVPYTYIPVEHNFDN